MLKKGLLLISSTMTWVAYSEVAPSCLSIAKSVMFIVISFFILIFLITLKIGEKLKRKNIKRIMNILTFILWAYILKLGVDSYEEASRRCSYATGYEMNYVAVVFWFYIIHLIKHKLKSIESIVVFFKIIYVILLSISLPVSLYFVFMILIRY